MTADESKRVRCSITIGFRSRVEAEKVHRSVSLDNGDYVVSRVEGDAIVAEVGADSLKSLLHTLDDFLACVGVADKVVSEDR